MASRPTSQRRRPIRWPIVAYDEDLADRIRELITDEPGVTERKMFGGLAFLVGGHMAVSASRGGGIMVRVDPEQSDRLVSTTAATRMVMRGREMDGWLRVDVEHVRTTRQLTTWVERGMACAASLAPEPRRQARHRS